MPEPAPSPANNPTDPPAPISPPMTGAGDAPPAADPAAPAGGGDPTPSPGAPSPAAGDAPLGDPAPPAGDPAPTLGQGGAGDDPPAPESPTNWPANWQEIMAGGDPKLLARLNRFASPVNLMRSWLSSQQKITSGEMIAAKPDGTDEAALNEWRAQAGIPEKPEGYLDKLPDGLVIGEADKPVIDTFAERMHNADAPPGLVHEALGWYYDHQETLAAERAEADRANRATNEDALRAEWGPEFHPNLNGGRALLDTYGGEDLAEDLFGARMENGSALGDHPALLKFLAGVNRELNPHGTVTPATGQTAAQTIKSEIQKLEALAADQRGAYWRGPEAETHQARLRELYEMEEHHQRRAG